MPDQREVGPLSRGVTSQPLSAPLQHGIRFLPPPLPAAPSARLAACFPSSVACEAGGATGLPRSADVPEWVRSRLYAGGSASAPEEFGASGPVHVPFWPKRISSLRLAFVTTLQRFTWVDLMPLDPGSRPPCCWQSQLRLAPGLPSIGRRLRCAGSFVPRRYRRCTSR
jgi:hypothetical protein